MLRYTIEKITAQVFVFAVFCLSMSAQPAQIWEENRILYPEERSIFLENKLTVYVDLENGEIKAWAEEKTDVLLLEEPRTNSITQSVFGSSLNEVSQISAYTLVPRRNRYRRVKVDQKEKKFERDDHIFYDDTYTIAMDFEQVQKKGRLEVNYRRDFFHPAFLPGRLFIHPRPCRKSVFKWVVHPDIQMEFRVFNDPHNQLEYREFVENGKKIYQWVARDLTTPERERNAPPLREIYPYVSGFIKSWPGPEGTQYLLGQPEDLGLVYEEFYNQSLAPPSTELKRIALQLQSETNGSDDYARAAFYWVQENIRYIAFEDGLRGLIPYSAATVCDQRYGDCKDMSVLLVSLLELAGLPGYPAWIGTRDIPQNYSELPSPAVDNHMIAVYLNEGGEMVFLDPTSNYTPFGFPSSMIQGKEALIRLSEGDYKISPVPFMDYSKNQRVDTFTARLEGRSIKGLGGVEFNGFSKVNNSYRLDRSNSTTVEDETRSIVQKGSNRFSLTGYEVQNLRNRDEPLYLEYEFEIQDYARILGDQLFINLNLDPSFGERSISPGRKYPLEHSFPNCRELKMKFVIPEGYAVEYTPNAVEIKNRLLEAEIQYRVDDKKIHYLKRICQKSHRIESEDFGQWNEAVSRLRSEFNEVTVLRKKEEK